MSFFSLVSLVISFDSFEETVELWKSRSSACNADYSLDLIKKIVTNNDQKLKPTKIENGQHIFCL